MTYCKYYREEKQVSYDNGQTWEDTGESKKGELYQVDSPDCYEHQRWEVVPDGYICEDKIKYQKEIFETSLDGSNYNFVYPPVYRKGAVIEYNSTDCMYKWFGTYNLIYVEPHFVIPTRVDPYKIVLCNNNSGILTNDEITLRLANCTTSLISGYIGDCVTSVNASFSSITDAYTTSVTVASIVPPTLESGVTFNGYYPIYVPCTSVDAYKSAPGWSAYASRIQAIPGSCASSTKWFATYTGGTTSSAECDASSAINQNEITLTDLASVEIGDCVTSIGYRAFYQCSSLSSIAIHSGVTNIGNYAFWGCTNLTSIVIPDSVTSIGNSVFNSCSGLTSVTIGSGVTSISDWTFYNCTSLTNITIPSGVTSIGMGAFKYCSNLSSITVNAITPPTLSYEVFDNTNNCPIYVPCNSVSAYQSANRWSEYASRITCIQPITRKWLATYSGGTTSSAECGSSSAITAGDITKTNLSSVEIGDCVTEIGNNVFFRSTISNVKIGNNVTSIGSEAFSECGFLTGVEIPNSVTGIRSEAFNACTGLTTVTIGTGVTSIGSYAFYYCTGLTSVTINATTPPTLSSSVFDYTNDCPIYVPAASVSTYQSASGWSTYASRIQAIP